MQGASDQSRMSGHFLGIRGEEELYVVACCRVVFAYPLHEVGDLVLVVLLSGLVQARGHAGWLQGGVSSLQLSPDQEQLGQATGGQVANAAPQALGPRRQGRRGCWQ